MDLARPRSYGTHQAPIVSAILAAGPLTSSSYRAPKKTLNVIPRISASATFTSSVQHQRLDFPSLQSHSTSRRQVRICKLLLGSQQLLQQSLGGGAALGFLNSCRPGVQVAVKAQAAELSGDLGKDAYTLRYSSPRTCLNLLAQADFAELKTHACH